MRTVVVGDVHGCYDLLKMLFDKLEQRFDLDRIIMLGDFFDRGPDVKKVLDLLMDYKGKHELICIQGNHDQMFYEAYFAKDGEDNSYGCYRVNDETYLSFGIEYLQRWNWKELIPNKYATWLKNLPLFFEDDHCFYCHAGIDPNYSLNDQIPTDLLWIRHEFLNYPHFFPKYIVHGHTPHRSGPQIKHNRLNMDVGAVFYGRMVACILEQDKVIEQIEVNE